MAEHYANAAFRHVVDSRTLLDASRWHGSAYVAGYVIECSLKACIAHPSVPPGIDLRDVGHDLSRLQRELDTLASSRQAAWKRHVSSQLLTALRSKLTSMKPMWAPSMRYEATEAAWQAQAESFWKFADRCFRGFAKSLVTEVAE